MYCPSCESLMQDNAKFCGKCGMFLNESSQKLEHTANDLAWIWRRSWAGFAAGFVGWILVFIVSRMIGGNISPMMNNIFGGMICGVFLGTAGGILEESAYKTTLGGILGLIGGALGGGLNIPITDLLSGFSYAYPLSILSTWAIGGIFIGLVSGLVEKSSKKMLAGLIFGLIGGALGGLVGSIFYGSVMIEFKPTGWMANRLIEGASGGLVGAMLWFFIGLIEKFYIFKRVEDPELENKTCSSCGGANPLKFWYCISCGNALQTSAPKQKIMITPYRGMERVANAFRFMSWLFGVAGIIISPIVFIIFLSQDIFLSITSAVFTVLFSYLLVVGFRFIADLFSCMMKLAFLKKPD